MKVKDPCTDFITVDVSYKRLKREINKAANKRRAEEQEAQEAEQEEEEEQAQPQESAKPKKKKIKGGKTATKSTKDETPVAKAAPSSKRRKTSGKWGIERRQSCLCYIWKPPLLAQINKTIATWFANQVSWMILLRFKTVFKMKSVWLRFYISRDRASWYSSGFTLQHQCRSLRLS